MTFYPNAAHRTLSTAHRRMLEVESRVSLDVSAERGTFTARRGADVPQGGGRLPTKPGLVFPVHTLDGGLFHRLRPNNPGRGGKYLQPKGAPNRLDVHPRQHERIKMPGGMRYITEGERKVDAGVSRGLLMVGQSGVFNGQRDKGAALILDWDLLPIEGEKYSICYDSDIETNPMVQLAADRLARLLRERGAAVFITLLPPAADGSKQGLDDFFAKGGTPKELELLTRPYEPLSIETVRLSRDERLRLAVEDLERRFWDFEWKGMGGQSDRDVFLKLVEAAKRHGKIHPDGLRVVKAWGPLMLEAKVSRRTLSKAISRLEERGLLYRDNEGRQADKTGAFVLRATVDHYGESNAGEGQATSPLQERVPGGLHLRAPRLMWSSPEFKPKRGTVKGTRKVRQGPPREPRPAVKRLGKIRGAILDALERNGGLMHINELAEALQRKRARDLRRRNLPMLEEARIIEVDGDTVSLTEDWLDRLEEQRELGGETEAERTARRRYRERSRAYHNRHKSAPDHHFANLGADGYIEDVVPADAPEQELSPLAVAMRDYIERNPHDAKQPPGWLGITLWAFDLCDAKPTPEESRAALEELRPKRRSAA